MPTLKAYRQEMLRIGPADLGEVFTLTSVDGQSAVCAGAATGGVSSGKHASKYQLRPDTVTLADRVRVCDGFESDIGAFTHQGPAYADVTATSEDLEILAYNPRLYDEAINHALGRTRYLDSSIVLASSSNRHWLQALDWITQPSDVRRITRSSSPVLSRNRYFDKWHTYSTAGVLTPPDSWTLTGATATVTRSTAHTYASRPKYTAALTRVGNNALLSQEVGLIEDGVSADSLRGQAVTAVLVCEASTASQVRIAMGDGVTQAFSSYHTGNSLRQELTAELTIAETASQLVIQVSIETTNGTAYLHEFYLVLGAASDSARRDNFPDGGEVWSSWEQGGATLPVILPHAGRGGAYRIWAVRGYAEFPAALIRAGGTGSTTVDTLSSDAPLTLIATGALARLYERLATQGGEDTTRYKGLTAMWTARAAAMAKQHLYEHDTQDGGGIPLTSRTFAMPARRF